MTPVHRCTRGDASARASDREASRGGCQRSGRGSAASQPGDCRQSGLTLLELLVALAIFAIVGSAIYSTFTTTLRGRDRALQRAQAYSLARSVLDRIESDLRGNIDVGVKGSLLPRFVAPGSGRGFGSERRPTFGNDLPLLELTTLSAHGVGAPEGYVADPELEAKTLGRGDQAHVIWRIEEAESDSDRGTALVRYELKPPRNDTLDLTLATRQVVAENVTVTLDFYTQGQWSEAWDSVAPGSQHNLAPALVRTTVGLAAADEEPVVLVSSSVLAMAADKRVAPATARADHEATPNPGPHSGNGDGAGKKKGDGKAN